MSTLDEVERECEKLLGALELPPRSDAGARTAAETTGRAERPTKRPVRDRSRSGSPERRRDGTHGPPVQGKTIHIASADPGPNNAEIIKAFADRGHFFSSPLRRPGGHGWNINRKSIIFGPFQTAKQALKACQDMDGRRIGKSPRVSVSIARNDNGHTPPSASSSSSSRLSERSASSTSFDWGDAFVGQRSVGRMRSEESDKTGRPCRE